MSNALAVSESRSEDMRNQVQAATLFGDRLQSRIELLEGALEDADQRCTRALSERDAALTELTQIHAVLEGVSATAERVPHLIRCDAHSYVYKIFVCDTVKHESMFLACFESIF